MTSSHLIGILLLLYALGVGSLCWNTWCSYRLLRDGRSEGLQGDPEAPLPAVDVVIPVKDEEANIGACVESVTGQDYPHLNVIVVNDRSSDGTAGVVSEICRRDSRVRRVDIRSLPEGVYGKPHALHAVAGELRGDVVAFVDSDFRLEPHCLGTLIRHCLARRLDWLAVMGTPELSFFWERLLVPLLAAVTYAWYDPRKISDPHWPDAIGSGFIIVRRDKYVSIGGHGAVLTAYDEDSEIMRLAKRAGHRIAYVLTPDLFRLRLYGRLTRTLHGIQRTLIGGIKTIPRFLITVGGLTFISHVPFAILIGLVVLSLLGYSIPWGPVWIGAAVIHAAAAMLLAALVYGGAATPRRYALLHPLGAAVFVGVCARAAGALRRRQRIVWRGTSY